MGPHSNTVIGSATRPALPNQLELLSTLAGPAFDRLTSLALRVLHAPIALISLIDQDTQYFKSAIAKAEPWASWHETPLSRSFCQRIVEAGEPLIIADARDHPLYRDSRAVQSADFVACAGMPLLAPAGQLLGAYCVLDALPRTWTEAEIDILRDLSALANTEIKLLIDNLERAQAEETARRLAEQHKRVLEVAQAVLSSLALDEILPQLQRALQMVVEHDALSIYWLDAAAGLLRPAHQVNPTWFSDRASSWPIPIDQGIAGAVARSGRAEMVNNAQLDPRSVFPPGTPDPPQHHQISIPLQVNEQIRGLFLMSRTSSEPFTEQEFELAQIFTSFASLAVENARLFEQIKLAEERQRLLLEQVPCRLWTTDRDLRYTSLVGITARELQTQPESMIGMSIYEFFGTDDALLQPIAAHRRALAGEPSAYELAWQGRVFQTHVQPFRDAQGLVTGCIGIALDITEHRQVEQALRESEERARRLSEVAFEGIAIHDQGVILDANQALADILGYEHSEIIGMPILNFAAPESRELISSAIRSGATQPYEAIGLRKNGTRITAEIQAKPTSYQGRAVRVTAVRDISARKQTEAALRESEERFRTLIGDLHVGVLLQGPQSEILLSNQAALDLLGLTEDQLLGKTSFAPDWNVIHEDGTPFPGSDHPVPQAIRTGQPVHDVVMGVYRPITKDRAWLLVNAEPQLADDGSVRQVICSFNDITERKQAEAALRESEDRYRTFFAHSIDAILLTAPDGSIFAANPAACQIFGRSEAEICQVGRAGVIDATDPRLAVALEQRARTGSFKGELTLLRPDGTRFPGELSTALFHDRNGLVKTSMIIRDITARKRAEEALRESQALLQGIIDHAPMTIVIQDIADGRYLLVNRSLENVTGLSAEQLLGKTLAELYPPENVATWRAQDRTIAITHQSLQVEDDIRHKDGTLHTSLGIKFPLYDTKGDVYAIGGIFTDITERKRAEQEREQLISALQEALANIKTLRGLLPICASCKKVRDDSGYWSQIEAYVQAHSDAVFSHGICPDCVGQLYGDLADE